jgi:DNA polymerase-1
MTPARITDFEEIWCVDCEFQAPDGERPRPICLVACELRSGRLLQLWEEDLWRYHAPPYAISKRSLFVAYYASAELGCHLALGWPLPVYVLELFVEFRVLTNGVPAPCGTGLLGALAACGLGGIEVAEKDHMRHLAMRGGPWTVEERAALLEYCAADVKGLGKLLARLSPTIDIPRALLRGRYMKAAAHMEHTGVPINTEALTMLRDHWTAIQDQLIARVNVGYGVYEGRTFKADRFEQWLKTRGIPWPRSPSGALALDHDIFREMARAYPAIQSIHELRATLSQMRLEKLAVGRDGRNRTLLSAFRATTGRNQPSTTKFIFGPAVWVRQLITPNPRWGIAYIDWEQQEFGIAAALSGDVTMYAAYESGNPYLAFAQQAGAIPPYGTKATHRAIRDAFKACALAVQYGMGPLSLPTHLGHPPSAAHDLLRMHRQTYPVFWA